MIQVFTDGGSRGNPGHSAYGFVVKVDGQTVKEQGSYIGIATNNIAEYTAVCEALTWLKDNYNGQEIFACLDSNLVVSQLNGAFKVKNPNMITLFQKAKTLEKNFKKIVYKHVPREQNKEADRQVNLALDTYLMQQI